MKKNNDSAIIGNEEKRARTSLEQGQNPLKSLIHDIKRDLKLNQNFSLNDNVVCKQIIPETTIKKQRSKKDCNPVKI